MGQKVYNEYVYQVREMDKIAVKHDMDQSHLEVKNKLL